MHGRPLLVLLLAAALAGCGGEEAGEPGQSGGGAGTTTAGAAEEPSEPAADLFAYDGAAPLEVTVRRTRKQAGATVLDVSYAAPEGPVRAYLVRPSGDGPFAGVLFLHWYDPGSDASNRTEFLEEAVALAREGVVSLLPEQRFPWHEGPSGPEADQDAVVAQVVALRRGLDVLAAEDGVDEARLGVVGHDYGGMYGALLAGFDRRPRAYALLAIDRDWGNWFVKYFVRTAAPADYEEAFAGIDPVDALAMAAPAAVFLQFAESDTYIPRYKNDEILEGTSEPKRMKLYAGGHELDEKAREERDAWLREELGLG